MLRVERSGRRLLESRRELAGLCAALLGVGCTGGDGAAPSDSASPADETLGRVTYETLPLVDLEPPGSSASRVDRRVVDGVVDAYDRSMIPVADCDEMRRDPDAFYAARRPDGADEIDRARLLASMMAADRACGGPAAVPDDLTDWTLLDWITAGDDDVASRLSAAESDPLLRACPSAGPTWIEPVPAMLDDDQVTAYAVGRTVGTVRRCETFTPPEPRPGAFADIAELTVASFSELGRRRGVLVAQDEIECARYRHDPVGYVGEVASFGPSEAHAAAYRDAVIDALDESCPTRFR